MNREQKEPGSSSSTDFDIAKTLSKLSRSLEKN